jgi:hypothetical protein
VRADECASAARLRHRRVTHCKRRQQLGNQTLQLLSCLHALRSRARLNTRPSAHTRAGAAACGGRAADARHGGSAGVQAHLPLQGRAGRGGGGRGEPPTSSPITFQLYVDMPWRMLSGRQRLRCGSVRASAIPFFKDFCKSTAFVAPAAAATSGGSPLSLCMTCLPRGRMRRVAAAGAHLALSPDVL